MAANLPEAPAAAHRAEHGHDHEAGLDRRLCGASFADDDLTGDEELPPATGGVERVA